MKLRYYTQHAPEKVQWAKDLFLREVKILSIVLPGIDSVC